MLAGLLAGMPCSRDVLGTLDTEYRCTVGDLFIVIDPRMFPGAETIRSGVKQYLDELRASRPAKGFQQVSVPGDAENSLREERLEKGIPHPEEVWHAAERLHATICN
jgi:LDH2 family malate/lactate/ureidoglycolate dehydrogenase